MLEAVPNSPERILTVASSFKADSVFKMTGRLKGTIHKHRGKAAEKIITSCVVM